jgi:predicted nucleic acid-binding protein
MKTKRNLRRITDKSVLWKALNIQCLLLTGDKNLRKEAEENGLEVRGCLWVISQLQKANILSNNCAILLLEKLKLQNQSLPKNEIDRLIFMYHDNI